MDITAKWIAKVAGWKANKEGKSLLEKGLVLSSNRNKNIITGSIQSQSARPTRVTIKIHSEIDIDITCPKPLCRKHGQICQHAVAILHHHILQDHTSTAASNQPEVQTSTKIAPIDLNCTPLQLTLPPNFPKTIFPAQEQVGSLGIKINPITNKQALPSDATVTQWLINHANSPSPPFISLKSKQAIDFLILLREHPNTFIEDQSVHILPQYTRLPLSVSLDQDPGLLQVQLSSHIQTSHHAWHHHDHLILWCADTKTLSLHPTHNLFTPQTWKKLAIQEPITISTLQFLQQRNLISEYCTLDNDNALQHIPISLAQPTLQLELNGSTHSLTAKLSAKYSETHTLALTTEPANQQLSFPIAHPSLPGHYLDRNTEIEQQAINTLRLARFQYTPEQTGSGDWQIDDADHILDFLTSTLPTLQQDPQWSIKLSQKIQSSADNIVRITPNFQLKPINHNSQDWLAYDLKFQTNQGKDIPKEIIQRMLTSGKRTGTSKNGKQVVISNFDVDMIESVLRDTNPQQENGLYITSKHQAAYLNRLKQHYTHTNAPPVDTRVISQLPESIQQTLRPYQEEGIAWLHHHTTTDGAALLADDMGLGKTLQTLSLVHLLKPQTNAPALVVCPTSLLGNWQAEAKHFFPELSTVILHGAKRKDLFNSSLSADIIITSYALIARDIEHYGKQTFSTLIIDEASIIRNPDTQAAKALCSINAEYRIALTGTPLENSITDLWSLYHFILPGYLGSRKDFQQHYEKPLASSPPDSAILQRLRMRISPFMLRRTKAKVAKDLPPKIHQTIYCEPTPTQAQTYEKLLTQGTAKIQSLEDSSAHIQILTILLRLRQAACDLRLIDPELDLTQEQASAKITRLLELLLEAKQGGHRVLVFSQFTSMLSLIKEALADTDLTYAYLDGATKNRSQEVDKFQADNGPDLFLISLKAGGYGLNLTAADTVIHFDPWWNPAVEAQATDRAYRIGQSKPTTVYKFITKGTVEEKILKLQESKQNLISTAISDENQPLMQSLTQQEISSLLLP